MLLGREAELTYLQQLYEKQGSQLLVVYGQKNIGKTSLLLEFVKNKPYRYDLAKHDSDLEQKNLWNFSIEEGIEGTEEKTVLILDEFHILAKSSDDFVRAVSAFISNFQNKNVLVILASSSIAWVENSMIRRMRSIALRISAFYKIKELSFPDIKKMFPTYSRKECLTLFSILGGNPGLLTQLDKESSLTENIRNIICEKNSSIWFFGAYCILSELRETAVYNTLLSALAKGKSKLNDLYLETGFSRAKISVYLKNLMELELVEKVFSLDTEGRSNAQKGIYRIQNPFAHFWYFFIFPNLEKQELLSKEEFYAECIEKNLDSYVAFYFKDFCMAYMNQQNSDDLLPYKFTRSSEWVGKVGTIDGIMEDDENHVMVSFCKYENVLTTYEDYEWNLFCLEKAKLKPEYIYLFTAKGFEESVELEAKTKKNLILIHLNQMFS